MMKKLLAALLALALVLTSAMAAVLAEEEAPAFTGGVKFNMDMDQVMELVNLPNHETDNGEHRGPTVFQELEYEDVAEYEGIRGDLTFLFVGNSMVAFKIGTPDGTAYDQVKSVLTAAYGEAVPFAGDKIGNARYVIDEDGDLEDCREMIEGQGVTIILEQDDDGGAEVTFLDPSAAYINN